MRALDFLHAPWGMVALADWLTPGSPRSAKTAAVPHPVLISMSLFAASNALCDIFPSLRMRVMCAIRASTVGAASTGVPTATAVTGTQVGTAPARDFWCIAQ